MKKNLIIASAILAIGFPMFAFADEEFGMATPCSWNGTCPCPIAADPISGNYAAWHSCVIASYPKNADGSTHVCRLAVQQHFNGTTDKVVCAEDQAGFGTEDIF